MKNIKAVIFDWAGTTVDYGCFAPVEAFGKAFRAVGITPTMEETRAPMGLPKRAHVAKMLAGERIRREFKKKYGREAGEEDIDTIYNCFEPSLFEVLENYAAPLPGAVETVVKLRAMGLAIGSTTGYTRQMMDVVEPLAKQNGYAPDLLVCPDDVKNMGRPYPYMLWRNLETLGIEDTRAVVKVGDTLADIAEGLHAGCISVGVLEGSSLLGLTQKETEQMPREILAQRKSRASQQYLEAGAHAVLDSIHDLPGFIQTQRDMERKRSA